MCQLDLLKLQLNCRPTDTERVADKSNLTFTHVDPVSRSCKLYTRHTAADLKACVRI